ncbi:MAG TPA: hypothetical protein VHX19_19785 [Stellaceae bacterium]|jgi:anti-sigma factor RsiW|nr:hypothetical protein [Stellaceae bacterium]
MSTPCAEPLSLAILIAYWLGELEAETERQTEEHFFACASCGENLEALAALAGGIRAAFHAGMVTAVISPAFLARMKERGMRVREYSVAPGGRVNCTVTAQDDVLLGRLKASLSEASRIDLLHMDEGGNLLRRYSDVPFDAAAGEVLLCPPTALLRMMPAARDTVRLLAVSAEGERILGEYVFEHAPS